MNQKEIVIALLLGGGAGSRLRSDIPKVFVPYQGEAILKRVANTFLSLNEFDHIIVTVPSGWEAKGASLVDNDKVTVIAGGLERQDSSKIALQYALQKYQPVDLNRVYILIHDIARCFVSPDIINHSLKAVREHGAVSVGIPSSDSLKEVSANGEVIKSLDRSRYWLVQTPQVFRADILLKAYDEADFTATDDAALVERFAPVFMVKGNSSNRKITFPEDLLE